MSNTTARGVTNNSISSSGVSFPLGQRNGSSVASIAAKLGGLEARMAKMEMGARANQISFSSMIGGDLSVVDLLGALKMKIGTHSDGKFGVSYHSGVAPPAPTVPLCSAREGYIVVGWDGEFDDGAGRPTDFARVDVHVSTADGFTPDATTAVASLVSEGVTLVPGGFDTYYIRLVAVTNADVPSPATDEVSAQPLPLTNFAAGSIAAIHFAAEIVLSTTIVAGDPNGAHLELNPTGIQMVRTDGTPTVTFSAAEGNAVITGSIQTATSTSGMARIVFNPFPGENYNAIRFYSPDGTTWSTMAASYDQSGNAGGLLITGPLKSTTRYLPGFLVGGTASLGIIDTLDPSAVEIAGLNIGTTNQQLFGGAISFLQTKNATDTSITWQPMTFAWIDGVNSSTHVQSVFQILEATTGGQLTPTLGAPYQDAALVLAQGSVSVVSYASPGTLRNIFAANTSSSSVIKKNIVDMSEVFGTDVARTPLHAVSVVNPKRFQRRNDVPDEIEVLVPQRPTDLSDQNEPQSRIEVMSSHQPEDRQEYGFIAEDIREVAPEAIMYDPEGRLHLQPLALCAVLWSAVQELSEKVEALTGSE